MTNPKNNYRKKINYIKGYNIYIQTVCIKKSKYYKKY